MIRKRWFPDKKEWRIIEKGEPKDDLDIWMSELRFKYLDVVKAELKNDMDHVEIISGGVGTGKSTLGRLDCRYVSDEKFHPSSHIVQDVNDIKPVLKNAKKREAILIDEGSGIFAGADTLTKKTKYANLVLDVCRQKNLLIVICAPNFHRLGAAVAIDRAMTLSRVYIHKKTGKRGRFTFYGTKQKEFLYRWAKKNHGSSKGPAFKYRGQFDEDNTFTDEYLKAKDETLDKVLDSLGGDKKEEEKKLTPEEVTRNFRKDFVKRNNDKTRLELAELMDVSARTIDNFRREIREANVIESANIPHNTKDLPHKSQHQNHYISTVDCPIDCTHPNGKEGEQ